MTARDLIRNMEELPPDAEILSVELGGEDKVKIVFIVKQKKQYTGIGDICNIDDI